MLESIDSNEFQKLLLTKTGKSSIKEITKEDIEKITSITFSGLLMNGSKSDIDVSAVRLFSSLERIGFSDVQINQELIDYLIRLKSLKKIDFVRCDFEEISFPEDIDANLNINIIGCDKIPFMFPGIKTINITGSSVDFERIDFYKSESIKLLECNIANAKSLEEFKNIKSLILDGSYLFNKQGEQVKDISVSQDTFYSHKDRLKLYDKEIN